MTIKQQQGAVLTQLILWLLVLANTAGLGCYYYVNYVKTQQIPNMIGTWSGENLTVSDDKGYKVWGVKTVTITEQQDRRFRGNFTYPDGTKNFFGVIYPDNKSFTWVSTPSKGFNHGRILDDNTIGACYVEAYEAATAGCATLTRQ
ncbi:MAG: hypothetical protein IBX57_07685 [Gammaproteobacteria bacterium]|nr:hypothetical protein [Gammaproteobacteria bacterium]